MAERKSGIELLRIIFFVMVVSIHIVSPYLTKYTVVGDANWLFVNFLNGISRIAVDGFVLISGFFYAGNLHKLDKKSIIKTVSKLLIPLAVYLPFYFILYLFLDYGGISASNLVASVKAIIINLPQNEGYFYHLWFIQVFFIITLLSPFFAVLISNINRRQHFFLILVLLAVCSLLPTIIYMTNNYFYKTTLINSRLALFTALYFTGAYFGKYPPNISGKKSAFILICSELLIVLLSAVYNYKFSPYIFFQKLSGQTLEYPFSGFIGAFYEPDNLLVVVTAVLALICFSKLPVQSKLINNIAKNVYGAYIIHVFWINIIAVFLHHRFNPYTNRWQESNFYPLLVIVEIIIITCLSLSTEFILSLISSIIRKRRKNRV